MKAVSLRSGYVQFAWGSSFTLQTDDFSLYRLIVGGVRDTCGSTNPILMRALLSWHNYPTALLPNYHLGGYVINMWISDGVGGDIDIQFLVYSLFSTYPLCIGIQVW